MTTAQDIITEALEISGLLPVGQTPGATFNTRGLTYLNEMLASWKNEGLDLQLDTLTATATVYLDKSDIMCIKQNLGVLLGNKFRLPIPAQTVFFAQSLLDDLNDKYLEIEEMELPAGLISVTRRNIETDS